MVSLPTRGTSLRLTASSATSRTVHRAWPSGGSLQTMAMIRCFWLVSNTSLAPGRCFSYSAPSSPDLLIAMAEASNRLRGERDYPGNLRGTGMLCQLQQGQGPQDHTDLLHPALRQFRNSC